MYICKYVGAHAMGDRGQLWGSVLFSPQGPGTELWLLGLMAAAFIHEAIPHIRSDF